MKNNIKLINEKYFDSYEPLRKSEIETLLNKPTDQQIIDIIWLDTDSWQQKEDLSYIKNLIK